MTQSNIKIEKVNPNLFKRILGEENALVFNDCFNKFLIYDSSEYSKEELIGDINIGSVFSKEDFKYYHVYTIIAWRDKYFVYMKNYRDIYVRYNFKNKVFERWYPNQSQWLPVMHQYGFFTGVSINDIYFEDKNFQKLIETINRVEVTCDNISSYITRIKDWEYLETYIQQGLNFKAKKEKRAGTTFFDGVRYPATLYDKNVRKVLSDMGYRIDEIFESRYRMYEDGVEEGDYKENPLKNFVLKISNTYLSNEEKCNYLRNFLNNANTIALINEYNYDVAKLGEFVYRYLVTFENFVNGREAMRMLRDYYRMALDIGRKPEKYPKYLKSVHDIIMANYRTKQENWDKVKFKEMIPEWLEYIPSGEKFAIANPREPNDIIDEGGQLNHCVSSYVRRIMNEETWICFLRKQESQKDEDGKVIKNEEGKPIYKASDESLITVEILNEEVIQAKGHYNRGLSDEEYKFLEKFVKMRGLKLRSRDGL